MSIEKIEKRYEKAEVKISALIRSLGIIITLLFGVLTIIYNYLTLSLFYFILIAILMGIFAINFCYSIIIYVFSSFRDVSEFSNLELYDHLLNRVKDVKVNLEGYFKYFEKLKLLQNNIDYFNNLIDIRKKFSMTRFDAEDFFRVITLYIENRNMPTYSEDFLKLRYDLHKILELIEFHKGWLYNLYIRDFKKERVSEEREKEGSENLKKEDFKDSKKEYSEETRKIVDERLAYLDEVNDKIDAMIKLVNDFKFEMEKYYSIPIINNYSKNPIKITNNPFSDLELLLNLIYMFISTYLLLEIPAQLNRLNDFRKKIKYNYIIFVIGLILTSIFYGYITFLLITS